MSMLDQIIDGSFASRAKLLQAREFYVPRETNADPRAAFAMWTERMAAQTERDGARELAGLSDTELGALEAEFRRCQTRPRAPWVRHAIMAGGSLFAIGLLALLLATLTKEVWAGADRYLQLASATVMLTGLLPLGVGILAAFGTLHLDIGHGTTGLYVGSLDEQHPWLYRATQLLRHPAADDYRRAVLADRGPLRGLDHVMMRELVRTQEALDEMRPARAVTANFRRQPESTDAVTVEPRLVRVTASAIK